MSDTVVPRSIDFNPDTMTPTSARPAPSDSDDEAKAIKLYDHSLVHFEENTKMTEGLQVPFQSLSHPQSLSYTPNPHKLDDRTTNREAFQPYAIERTVQPAPGLAYSPSPHKFVATTVSHDDYRAPLIASAAASSPQRLSYTPNPHKLDDRTTTGEAYKAISIPRGTQALGVRTQGGMFHPLIPQGSRVPVAASAIFTTTYDNQQSVSIKVRLALRKQCFTSSAMA